MHLPQPADADYTALRGRPVWVRVPADDERPVERELPADARIVIKAEKTIVIRTGDHPIWLQRWNAVSFAGVGERGHTNQDSWYGFALLES